MLYDYTEKMRLLSSMLLQDAGDMAWQALVQTVARLRLPNLTIERSLPPTRLIELSRLDPAGPFRTSWRSCSATTFS
jgi:hypothetical protein